MIQTFLPMMKHQVNTGTYCNSQIVHVNTSISGISWQQQQQQQQQINMARIATETYMNGLRVELNQLKGIHVVSVNMSASPSPSLMNLLPGRLTNSATPQPEDGDDGGPVVHQPLLVTTATEDCSNTHGQGKVFIQFREAYFIVNSSLSNPLFLL